MEDTDLKDYKFDELMHQFNLDKMYYIGLVESESNDPDLIFGIRIVPDTECNLEKLKDEVFRITNRLKIHDFRKIILLTSAKEEVESLMAWTVRPYAHSHGGDITLEDLNEQNGTVIMFLDGMCSGCPSSLVTMRYGVESMLKESLPWVKRVITSNEPEEPDFGFMW